MKTAKKVAMSIALVTSLVVSTGCAEEEADRGPIIIEQENKIAELQEKLREAEEKRDELNELAYMNGERVKWLQEAYDELLTEYNAIKPKEIIENIDTIATNSSVEGTAHRFTCTWYTPGGLCANGEPAEPGVIAVDPSVIPLGTWVYVQVDGSDTIQRLKACDTGGAIVGNIIDICSYDIPSVGRTGCTVWY